VEHTHEHDDKDVPSLHSQAQDKARQKDKKDMHPEIWAGKKE
jgi:hypothetical protein